MSELLFYTCIFFSVLVLMCLIIYFAVRPNDKIKIELTIVAYLLPVIVLLLLWFI